MSYIHEHLLRGAKSTHAPACSDGKMLAKDVPCTEIFEVNREGKVTPFVRQTPMPAVCVSCYFGGCMSPCLGAKNFRIDLVATIRVAYCCFKLFPCYLGLDYSVLLHVGFVLA